MPLRRPLAAAALLLALTLAPPPGARAGDEAPEGPPADAEILPLASVRPGMRGTGWTVKAGTRIEPFEVEVVDVMTNYLAKQDVILVRCLGEDFAQHQIAQGMSGSPVYVDGRIMGALSYTWAWAKEALGGVTPIESMLAEGARPLEGRPSGAEPPTPLRHRRLEPLDGLDGGVLRPIATPLGLSGFSPEGLARAAETFAPLGMPVRATGGALAGLPRGAAALDAPLVPGAALVVDLVRGDYAVSALGTCTYVKDGKAYGFGHGFQEVGETLFPMSVGYVYSIVASREISFKLGAPLRPVGAITQDRPSGIVGVLGQEAPMVPFDVEMRNRATGRSESFHFEVSPNTIYFQPLMLMVLREAFGKAEATLGGNTKRYRMEVRLRGLDRPFVYEDVIAGFDGGLSRILIGLVDRVLIHPTQRAEFESVRLEVEIEHVDRRATIEAAVPVREEVRPGETVDAWVRLRQNEGGDVVLERVSLPVPPQTPPGEYVVTIVGGDDAPADVASPVDIADLPALYAAFHKSTELVAMLPNQRVDVDVDGHLVRGVPLSALPRLARALDGGDASLRPGFDIVKKTVPWVLTGRAALTLRVRP